MTTPNTEATTPQVVQKYYDKIFSGGKLTNVNIGIWGMSCKLESKDVKIDSALPDMISLGKKMLIKPSVYNTFKTIEGRARACLYRNSFAFPLVPQAHFIPANKFKQVYLELAGYRTEFYTAVDEFIENYASYKAESLAHYEEFKDQVNVDGIEARYPAVESLREKFYFNILSFEVTLPTSFAEVDLQTEIARESVVAGAAQEAAAQYSELYQTQLNEHMSKISEFSDAVVAQLKEGLIDLCRVAEAKINKKELLPEKGAKHILTMVEHLREMNFMNNEGVNQQLASIELLLNGEADLSKDRNAVATLRQHLQNVVTTTENLSDVNTSGEFFRKITV